MVLKPSPHTLIDTANLSESDAAAVLARARAFQVAGLSGPLPPLLRGKHLAVLCDAPDDADAAAFEQAALALGAQVSRVHPDFSPISGAAVVQQTARLLGRLYDAVDCVGMTPAQVRWIRATAGIPVFDGLAAPGHPTAALVHGLAGGLGGAGQREWVIQAVLAWVLT